MIETAISPSQILAETDSDVEICLTNTGPDPCTNIVFTLRMPAGLVRLRGRDRITLAVLAPGESFSSYLRVRAGEPGSYALTSPNFSFRDHRGQPHRTTFAAEIRAEPGKARVPVPGLHAELLSAQLPLDEWSILRGRVTNVGDADALDVEVTLSGQITADERGSRSRIDRLRAGASAEISFNVCPRQAGSDVPVHFDLTYRSHAGSHRDKVTHMVRVAGGHPAGPSVIRILFLGASPPDLSPIRIDEEIREIQQEIQLGKHRDRIHLVTKMAVRPRDISRALLEVEPHFVHFAGHGGGGEESFAAEDDLGNASLLPVDGLVELFEVIQENVECVLVNACNTEQLARGLSPVVPWVIGMRQPVGDRSAIRFSIGFYQALAAGRPIEHAFRLGRAQMRMTLGSSGDPLAPLLLRRHG